MKTPITDKLKETRIVMGKPRQIVDYEIARRLELDRAALMNAIAEIDPWPEDPIVNKDLLEFGLVHDSSVYCNISVGDVRAIRAALSAARVNFPES